MNNEINLLPSRKKSANKDGKQFQILRFSAIGLLLFITTASIGLFLITALSPLNKLKEEEEQLSNTLDDQRVKVVSYAVTLKRLDDIESYLALRNKYPETLDNMQGTASEDVKITGVKLDEKNVSLIVSSSSLQSMNDMISSLKFRSEEESLFKNFALSKLNFNGTDNLYTVGLEVELK